MSDEQPTLDVENLSLTRIPGGARIVTGELVNDSKQVVATAQIQVSLFDEGNQFVASMSIPVENIEPGARVPFREPVDSDADVHAARVRSVVAF